MTRARRAQVSLVDTPYYHCISRCVRRAFLCGEDRASGRNFDHRRGWIKQRLARLVDVFAIDLCAYAIMSNHYHLVLRVNTAQAGGWTDREVVERWRRLHRGPELVKRFLDGESLSVAETAHMDELIALWRERLMDISWFMRELNGHIAREANREDGCKGHFFEGRFKSQALLDEKAVLACMAYVDLNPVRAGVSATPEASDYTSVQQRAEHVRAPQATAEDKATPELAPMVDAGNIESDWSETVCEIRLLDYLQLVEETGRALREGMRGAMSPDAIPILGRLGIDRKAWFRHMQPRPNPLLQALGSAEAIRAFAHNIGRRWLWGLSACRGLCEDV